MSTIAKLSLAEYERIVAAGIFDGRNRRSIELIRGELRERPPHSPMHCDIVSQLANWSFAGPARDKLRIRLLNPLAFSTIASEPEPDVVWVKPNNYRHAHPTADDVLLVIEVADSSLQFDRGEKADMYAAAGIQDYWVVNLIDQTIEVRRYPIGESYRNVRSFGDGEFVVPLAVPETRLSIDSLFDGPD